MAAPAPGSTVGVSRQRLGFMDEHFKTRRDLSKAPSFAAHLTRECRHLESDLLDLEKKLSGAAAAWAASSCALGGILSEIDPGLEEGGGRGCMSQDGDTAWALPPEDRRISEAELALLVKEVRQIETIRLYAETTLKLEVLVGDLEDTAFWIMGQTSKNNLLLNLSKPSSLTDTGWKEEKLLLAVKTLKDIEKLIASFASSRPSWVHLLTAVDCRIEDTVRVLRSQALIDHRALLASVGWPPSFLMSNIEKDKSSELLNPLVLMQGILKERYSRSFIALCVLQHLQAQQEARHGLLQHKNECKVSNSTNLYKQTCFTNSLWTINELVHPVALRMERHFSRWSDQPQFIFALVYKTTRDFLEGVDNVLQPLIDQARLVGYSAKEAWITAMVKMFSEYLTSRVFPVHVKRYHGKVGIVEASSLWLHLIDLMISFDKWMKVLAAARSLQMGPFTEYEGFSPLLSVMSIFDGHPDWLQIWADVELKDGIEKLQSNLEDEKSWMIDNKTQAEILYEEEAQSFLLSTREDYKAPLIADSVVRLSWAMIERSRALPNKPIRKQFIMSSVSIFLKHFFHILLQRCQGREFMAVVTEDNMLARVATSVNTARYLESVLQELSEDVSFLEMSIADSDVMGRNKGNLNLNSSFFADEMMLLAKLEADNLVEIMSALLLQFEDLCYDYIQNIEQWGAKVVSSDQIMEEENWSVTLEFVGALDMLKDRIGFLKVNLNPTDFLHLWRSIADGLDRFIYKSIPLSNAKFSCWGINQFKVDSRALFFIFRPLCVRPESFFPCISDSLKLLTMSLKDTECLLEVLPKGEIKMSECL